jgi:hypothetical protein
MLKDRHRETKVLHDVIRKLKEAYKLHALLKEDYKLNGCSKNPSDLHKEIDESTNLNVSISRQL